MRKLAAGNWKMNGTFASLAEAEALLADHPAPGCDMLLCPPTTLLAALSAKTRGSQLAVGGQDCHSATSGAHTGDISAAMLKEAGADYVILGHSERRNDHGESDAMVKAKATAAWQAGLIAIICLGESEAQRDAGQTLEVIAEQLAGSVPQGANGANTVIAYEPVWAIGTGRTPTDPEIAEVHALIRRNLGRAFGDQAQSMRLLYGGSVKPSNAKAIFALPNVDGALVGGASLTAKDFGAIVSALSAT